MLRSAHTAVVLFLLLATGCDSVEEDRFTIEVLEIDAVEPSEGPPALQVQFHNAGSEPLSSVSIEFTVHPQQQLTSGTSVSTLLPGEVRTAEVKLLHINQHSDYTCYRSQIIAFTPEQEYAVIDRAGPATCK